MTDAELIEKAVTAAVKAAGGENTVTVNALGVTTTVARTPLVKELGAAIRAALATILDQRDLVPKVARKWTTTRPTKAGVYRVRGNVLDAAGNAYWPIDERFVHAQQGSVLAAGEMVPALVVCMTGRPFSVARITGEWCGPFTLRNGDWVEE